MRGGIDDDRLVEGGDPMSAVLGVPPADDAAIGLELPTITDEFMKARLSTVERYTVAILRKGPNYRRPDVDPVIWEHGRRNMALEQAGLLPVVCPTADETDFSGIGILTVPVDRATEILEQDPAIKRGVLTVELHPIRGFPGAGLPADC
jgi:hypothetical protein